MDNIHTEIEFLERLNRLGCDRHKLISFMDEIDAWKRLLKSQLKQSSSEPVKGRTPIGRARMTHHRKLKDKISFYIEYRDKVRQKLRECGIEQRKLNRVESSKAPKFLAAFMQAAENELDEEVFLEIEVKAMTLLRDRGDV